MSLLALLSLFAALVGVATRQSSGSDDAGSVPVERDWTTIARIVSLATLTLATAVGASILARTALAAIPVLALGVYYTRWSVGLPRILPPTIALYLTLFLLALVLFLGLEPIQVDGVSVRGLYYYLHNYVPGFNGIRKVSRQAIIVMMMVAVLGGYGAAELLRRWPTRRLNVTTALVLVLLLELACVPMGLARVPAGRTVPSAYGWLKAHRSSGPIAVLPTRTGVKMFRGNVGLALHNYLTLYHRHRTINGKSSWIPPITHLFHKLTQDFPTPAARRLLQALGVEHVLIHSADLQPASRATMIAALDKEPGHYERVFHDGADYIYRIKRGAGPAPRLLSTPAIPQGAQPVHRWNVRGTASRSPEQLHLALDDRLSTRWSTGRPQVAGDYVELQITRVQDLAAIELRSPEVPFELPAAFEVSVGTSAGESRVVLRRTEAEIYEEQVLRPRSFVFRIVFPPGTMADRVRITLLQALAETPWTIQEAGVWVRP